MNYYTNMYYWITILSLQNSSYFVSTSRLLPCRYWRSRWSQKIQACYSIYVICNKIIFSKKK